ncbi:MAG TPA: Kiwa anti-phage protein KwaB-like domain-containing protein [Terriglobales bacterium]|nr:Kiwa anti-phage protein KwaB-like domain-containing protein [Terriglobales bacterium]
MARKQKPANDMTDQFNQILAMNLDGCTVTVCLGSLSKDRNEPSVEQLQLTKELTEEFANAARKAVRHYSALSGKNELALRQHDAGSKPDSHEVEYLDLADHDSVTKQVDSLASLAQIPVFKIDDKFIAGLRFYAIVFQCGNAPPLYFFRIYTPKKELSRSRLFAALFGEGTFDRVKDPMFLFDHNVDCLSYDGTMYIFNKHNFEKIFRFFELVTQTAAQTLATIKTHVPIANFDELEKACTGHLQMQAKLKNIAGKPYLKKMKMADIKKVLKHFPTLGLKTIKKDGNEMLLFDPKDKWALLRLLDDDYLDSVLTGQKYEVTGKRPYQPEG